MTRKSNRLRVDTAKVTIEGWQMRRKGRKEESGRKSKMFGRGELSARRAFCARGLDSSTV